MRPSDSEMIIIGVGNEYRGDDAVGLLVARKLKRKFQQTIEILEYNSDITGMMEAWGCEDFVILVDAIWSDEDPGTIVRFDARSDPLPSEFFRCSTHVVDIGQFIELARILERLPKCLTLYAITGRKFNLGDTISDGVSEAVKEVTNRIEEEIKQFRSQRSC